MPGYDPAAFAELGVRIAETEDFDPESRSRTALGRAYYALFLATRVALRNAQGRDIDVRIRNHGRLTDHLFSSHDDGLIALGKVLQELYDHRQKADYVLAPKEGWHKKISVPATASLKAKVAQNAIERIESLDFSPIIGKDI